MGTIYRVYLEVAGWRVVTDPRIIERGKNKGRVEILLNRGGTKQAKIIDADRLRPLSS